MKNILLGFILCISVSVSAENLYCGGKISSVYISATADLVVKGDWRGDWTKLCNLKSDPLVDVVTCSLWASYAASAFQNNASVLLLYSTSISQCALLPTYTSSPTPIYFMMTK